MAKQLKPTAKSDEFIIHTKMLEITLWLFEKANTFPKPQRLGYEWRITG